MKDRLTEQDITDYALNELGPRERLYVESLLLGSEALREDASSQIEAARLLEMGFSAEYAKRDVVFSLDASRREAVLAHCPSRMWENLGKMAAGLAALAACVAFSVAAPVVWNLAVRPMGGSVVADVSRSVSDSISSSVVVGASTEGDFFSFQAPTPEDSGSSPSGLLPKVTIGFMEMPLPGRASELN